MSSSTAAKTMWETATFGQVLVNVIKKEWPWVTGFATVGAVQAYMHLNLTGTFRAAVGVGVGGSESRRLSTINHVLTTTTNNNYNTLL